LIDDGATGMLVEAGDPAGLAKGLETLIRQPALRRRLGDAGYRRIQAQFDMEKGIDLLLERFAGGKEAVTEPICDLRSMPR
jgi:glycosyltransferase involved in cell wall biosynthesis